MTNTDTTATAPTEPVDAEREAIVAAAKRAIFPNFPTNVVLEGLDADSIVKKTEIGARHRLILTREIHWGEHVAETIYALWLSNFQLTNAVVVSWNNDLDELEDTRKLVRDEYYRPIRQEREARYDHYDEELFEIPILVPNAQFVDIHYRLRNRGCELSFENSAEPVEMLRVFHLEPHVAQAFAHQHASPSMRFHPQVPHHWHFSLTGERIDCGGGFEVLASELLGRDTRGLYNLDLALAVAHLLPRQPATTEEAKS